jgi:hypothetical protein
MPLFDQLYNFGRWLTKTAPKPKTWCKTYQTACDSSPVSAATNFRVDVSHPQEFFSEFALDRNKTTIASMEKNDDDSVLPAETTTPERDRTSDREIAQQAPTELVPFREILLCARVEEMSYQEISKHLSFPLAVMSACLELSEAPARFVAEENDGGRYGV